MEIKCKNVCGVEFKKESRGTALCNVIIKIKLTREIEGTKSVVPVEGAVV